MRSAPLRPLLGAAAALLVLAAGAGAATLWADKQRRSAEQAEAATGGVIDRAIPVMLANGCAGCHTISGVPMAQGQVGPALDASLAGRVQIGGVAPHTTENLVRWIRAAREMNPRTAMPSTGISEQEARDVAAYLYALR